MPSLKYGLPAVDIPGKKKKQKLDVYLVRFNQ